MSIYVTTELARTGKTVHRVRLQADGRKILLTFPFNRLDLARSMVAEGTSLDEAQHPALIEKYSLELAKTEPPGLPNAPEVKVEQPRILPHNREIFVCDPVPAQPDADPLAALLTAAREAEIVLAFRKGEYRKIQAELVNAESAVVEAWANFNEALRTALPEDTGVRGVVRTGEST